jgi:hypothetical protein
MRSTRTRRLFRLLLAMAALGVGGCESLVGGDERREPAGLVVLDARGNEVASYRSATGTVSGGVTVAPGSTRTFQVHLTDRSGGRISVDGVRYALQASAVTSAVAGASATGGGELQVTGRVAGNTSLALTVLDSGVAVFSAVFIPLTVRAG